MQKFWLFLVPIVNNIKINSTYILNKNICDNLVACRCCLSPLAIDCFCLCTYVLIGHFVVALALVLAAAQPWDTSVPRPYSSLAAFLHTYTLLFVLKLIKLPFMGRCSICFHGHLSAWTYAAIKLNVMYAFKENKGGRKSRESRREREREGGEQ